MISAIKDLVAASPVPVVFDHFGGAQAELGPAQPGFADLLALVQSGKAYVKISGAYRASKLAPDYPDVVAARAGADRGQCRSHHLGHRLAASEFGHAAGRQADRVTPLFQIDDGRLLNQLPVWAPDAAIRKKILVDNPARLYGF